LKSHFPFYSALKEILKLIKLSFFAACLNPLDFKSQTHALKKHKTFFLLLIAWVLDVLFIFFNRRKLIGSK
jgi:hypothetical protein